MKLKQYISTLKRGGAKKLAEKIGASPSYLSQMASGVSPVPPALCPAIEEATSGVVTRADLRPKDWSRIWPEYVPAGDQATPQNE
ncbi:transcriptional regulator [Serratia marcescens]|uniref:transcriptional regulator n=1 Tax=Serratia marcescens TaxID=615 RepID=UPI000931E459|nr:YdaS family helix-turn-helix protein [Serratia marcescens]